MRDKSLLIRAILPMIRSGMYGKFLVAAVLLHAWLPVIASFVPQQEEESREIAALSAAALPAAAVFRVSVEEWPRPLLQAREAVADDARDAPQLDASRSFELFLARPGMGERGTQPLKAVLGNRAGFPELSLPAAPIIAGVIRDKVRRSETPYECKAHLIATLNGVGEVTAFKLSSFSGGTLSAWEKVRAGVLTRLKKSRFQMTGLFKHGAIIEFGVISSKAAPGMVNRDVLMLRFDVTDISARNSRRVRVGWSTRLPG